MLEFACGTGLISGELVLFIAEVVNVDISQDMADINEKARAKGFDVEDMYVVCLNLLGEDVSVVPVQTAKQIGVEKFDLIRYPLQRGVPPLPDPAKALSARLAAKGSLLVADLALNLISREFLTGQLSVMNLRGFVDCRR